ncbi:hypothetical protein [Methanobacterium formicicum]|uniref:Uncharacterized protein n=1 Tax=Methanobacterium formicicum TaxID=2162 RepID=A0A843AI98_METFO|nr:hypothetical protein [Methanobacterium formicicum]MBF4474519.1 hypothetical protein [Methanobacterium formicicum]
MIDYERLKLKVTGDIHPELRDRFDINTIVHNAVEKNGMIIVQAPEFWFKYDAKTYVQLGGGGGISDE